MHPKSQALFEVHIFYRLALAKVIFWRRLFAYLKLFRNALGDLPTLFLKVFEK